MFIAPPFIIARTWKQPYPLTDEYIKVWYVVAHTHTVEYYSAIKKHETMSFTVIWMD